MFILLGNGLSKPSSISGQDFSIQFGLEVMSFGNQSLFPVDICGRARQIMLFRLD